MRALALSVLLLSSCGGKTETGTSGTPTDADECSIPDKWITSTEAIGVIRCPEHVGPDAVVVSLVSSRLGEMDEQGRSPRWDLLTWSRSTEHLRLTQLDHTHGLTMDEPVESSCPDPPSTDPAPSDEVIPDAMERTAPFDPYEDKRFTARFYRQQYEPCLTNPGPSGVGIIRSTTRDNSVRFYLDYSWSGEFNRICGPCLGGSALDCQENCQ